MSHSLDSTGGAALAQQELLHRAPLCNSGKGIFPGQDTGLSHGWISVVTCPGGAQAPQLDPEALHQVQGHKLGSFWPLHRIHHWFAVFLRAITWPFLDTIFFLGHRKKYKILRHKVLQTHPDTSLFFCRLQQRCQYHLEISRSPSPRSSSNHFGFL